MMDLLVSSLIFVLSVGLALLLNTWTHLLMKRSLGLLLSVKTAGIKTMAGAVEFSFPRRLLGMPGVSAGFATVVEASISW